MTPRKRKKKEKNKKTKNSKIKLYVPLKNSKMKLAHLVSGGRAACAKQARFALRLRDASGLGSTAVRPCGAGAALAVGGGVDGPV